MRRRPAVLRNFAVFGQSADGTSGRLRTEQARIARKEGGGESRPGNQPVIQSSEMHSERGLGPEDCFTSCGAEAPSHCGIAGSARCRATSAVMISRIAINSCGGIPRTYWRNCSRRRVLMRDYRPATYGESTHPTLRGRTIANSWITAHRLHCLSAGRTNT